MAHGQRHMLIACEDSSMTGVNILDEQHRCFAGIVNSLHYALTVRHDPAILVPTVAMVMSFFKIHCTTEIELLKESHYPQVLEHQALHDHIIAEGNYFVRCLKEEEHGLDPEAYLLFLKKCWQKHVLHEDKVYSQHMIEFIRSQRVIKKGH